MNSNDRTLRILQNNNYMVLATIDQSFKPWCTPVFYAYDDAYNFYWYSQKNTRHSQAIINNPSIASVIFGTGNEDEGFGVYIEGIASEVSEDKLQHVLTTYAAKAAKTDEQKMQLTTTEDFLGDSPLRMYQLTPEKMYLSHDATKWNGKWIDGRIEIKLK